MLCFDRRQDVWGPIGDKVQLFVSGEHTTDSHADGRGISTVKQLAAVESSVRSAPLAVGSQVHANLKDFSPGKHVASDKANQASVARLVRKHRKELMAARIPGINLDDTEGAIVRLAQSRSLSRHIKKHNDPADPYHLNEHQTFCLGYQFKDGVTFMCFSTTHMLLNLARMENCGWQKQIHLDGAFNWCVKDFGLIGIGCNRMGAHFNPISLSIVNSESAAAIESSWDASVKGMYSVFKNCRLCDSAECGFCVQVREQHMKPHMRALLLSEDAQRNHFPVDKPSSDCTKAFFSFSKKKFGPNVKMQNCCQHATGECISSL
jgi:hypothetical protein